MLPHLPVLRAGRPYRSLDRVVLADLRTGEPVVEVSQANPGLIARDLARAGVQQRALAARPVAELLAICQRAGELFLEAELPLGEGGQSPADYLRQLAATTGFPETLGRANMAKIHRALTGMAGVVAGLTRGLDPEVLDAGWGSEDGRTVSYLRQTDALGAVLPNNSPGVHSLWLPALPLKVALALKPGRREPWTPYRIAQALIAAGCPPEAFGFYPADYPGATEILLRCGRAMLFGDQSTLDPWRRDPRVELHGPGWSKVLVGADQIAGWPGWVDLMATSIADNGGRSCINASSVWVPAQGRAVAQALAERLAAIAARPLDHPEARLAAFPEPAVAQALSERIDRQLAAGGAEDLTARLRGGPRLVAVDGLTFLLPTLVWCDHPDHPLARAEYLFPFAAVVEVPQGEMLNRIGPTLVASAVTADREWIGELLACPAIDRLNLGPVPTSRVSWDQPHEGNLFQHLYQQRAFQEAALGGVAAAAGR